VYSLISIFSRHCLIYCLLRMSNFFLKEGRFFMKEITGCISISPLIYVMLFNRLHTSKIYLSLLASVRIFIDGKMGCFPIFFKFGSEASLAYFEVIFFESCFSFT